MYIVSIRVNKRKKKVPDLQEVLTKHGDNIYARLGLHNQETDEENGIIIIAYDAQSVEKFVEELRMIQDLTVNYMNA